MADRREIRVYYFFSLIRGENKKKGKFYYCGFLIVILFNLIGKMSIGTGNDN